jgi:hypothetical protein
VMFSFFRRKPEPPEEPTQEEIERQAEIVALEHIEAINSLIPLLPYGTLPWMDWGDRPPRLKLKRRRYDADEIITHHAKKRTARR